MDQERTLEEVFRFVETKEAGARSAAHLASKPETMAMTSQYRQQKSHNRKEPSGGDRKETTTDAKGTCTFCGEEGHGERALPRVRAKECSAWDHPCKKCNRRNHWESLYRTRMKTQDEPETANADMEAATFDTFCGITSGAQEVTHRVDVDDIKALRHHIYNEQKDTWLKGPSEPHPYITLKVCVYPENYDHLGCQTPPETMQSHTIEAMADTGCQSCLASETLIQKLGIKREHLIKVRLQMKTANKQQVKILGAILVRFRGTDHEEPQERPGRWSTSRRRQIEYSLVNRQVRNSESSPKRSQKST